MIKAYKGFEKDFTCLDYQYEVGKTYEHQGEVNICHKGFHSCEYPLECFRYYAPAQSRYAEVIVDGQISRNNDSDSKIASAKITITAELSIHQLVTSTIEWILSNKEDRFISTNTDYHSVSVSTEDYSASSNSGYYSIVSNTGAYSASSNTGPYSVSVNTGDHSASGNTGNQSVAINRGADAAAEVSGYESVAAAFGVAGRAKASVNSAIVLCYRDKEGTLLHIRASKVGDNGIKADTWYTIDKDGEFIETME